MHKIHLKKFTLIELMISLLIMGIVMIAIWQITIGVMTSRKFIQEDYEPTKAGSIALNLLLKEISFAHKFYLGDLPISEEEEKKYNANRNGSERNSQYLMLFNGELIDVGSTSATRLELYSTSSLYDPRKGGIPFASKIQYYLETYESENLVVKDRYDLKRASLEAGLRFSEHGEAQVVLPAGGMIGFSVYKGVRLFRIQYYNGLEWIDTWTTSSEKDVPMAVRIDMVINKGIPNGESLPEIKYTSYDAELELAPGDVRLKGMTTLPCSEKSVQE